MGPAITIIVKTDLVELREWLLTARTFVANGQECSALVLLLKTRRRLSENIGYLKKSEAENKRLKSAAVAGAKP